jgi:hypothetical protein
MVQAFSADHGEKTVQIFLTSDIPSIFDGPRRKPVKNDLTSNRPRIFGGPKLTTKNDYIFDGPNKPWKIFGAGEKNALFL